MGVDYQHWTADKTIHIGDVVVFNYNNQFHNVMQMNKEGFGNCSATSPIATYTSESDSINLDKEGRAYFICGFPSHCELGQKLTIFVNPINPNLGESSPCSVHRIRLHSYPSLSPSFFGHR
ncbi:Cupredoxin superfamily protein [Euphorbia peplus]|nr:Cupredoxin superfamily protein [Euphorbia peplus]